MNRCIVTITPVVKDKSIPTVVLDITPSGVSVNYPKGFAIELDSIPGGSHVGLLLRLPDYDKEFHLQCKSLASA